jgi:hypothetical protein
MPGPFKFAWAGGTITEQQTLVVNGNTHGGLVETITLVGDTEAGIASLRNIASSSGLEAGALYTIAGPGLADGTFFIYDVSILTEEGSINLSDAASGTLNNATFVATKSILIGSTAAAMTQGSHFITLVDDIGLLPGLYCVSGTSIGETASPASDTETVFVSTAWVSYSGGGVFAMYILVPGGMQPVWATSTGTYAIRITGMPTADWYSVTSIPAGALAGLTAGLRYNIAGNGIQVGTTFLADSSATTITLDLPASSTSINAILTITGPRTPNADFDPAVHNREDEQIVALEISQEEGGFATLTIEIRNPNIGLLAFGRNLWAWLSWDQAWTPEGGGAPDLVPLFNGRLIGVPTLSVGETVQLQFLARPDDFNAQKDALVSDMSVLPYYDPIWLAANVNPDTVLETYSSLWHIDRVSLVLTASDILQGEAGVISVGEDAAFYDSFSLSYGSTPLTAITLSGTVSWNQQGEGAIDITQTLIDAFAAGGSPYKTAFGKYVPPRDPARGKSPAKGGGLITCICGDGLRTDWPKPGTSIGGGWSLSTGNDGAGQPLCYCIDALQPNGWMQAQTYNVKYGGQSTADTTGMTSDQANVAVITEPYGQYTARFPINIYKIQMVLDWKADRPRTETVTAVLTANVQRELSDTADSDREDMSYSSEYVDKGIDPGGEVPLGSISRRSYFQTDRGAASFEYLLLAARAKMRARARSVDITFGVDWYTALGITLRHSVIYLDRRLPGGAATGKVKSYKLTAGETMAGEFTIGCSIGNDDLSSAAEGVLSYVELDYVDPGYQVIVGGQKMLLDEELAYESLDNFVIDDDNLDLTNMTVDRAVNECVVVNGLTSQFDKLSSYQRLVAPTASDPISAMKTATTAVTLDLKPLTGNSFHTTFFPAVSQLWLPKTIDLAASSGRRHAV